MAVVLAVVDAVVGIPTSAHAVVMPMHAEFVGAGGTSVAISGTTALIGSEWENSYTGAAYVFTKTIAGWTQTAELTASDGVANDEFGVSVAISGSTAIVGAPGRSSVQGAAYVFKKTISGWVQTDLITASDGAAFDQFGESVAVVGGTAIVGAPSHNSGTGAAYVFKKTIVGWTQAAALTASDGAVGDQFGTSVSVSGVYGASAIVGAPGHNSAAGAAYVFISSTMSGWSQAGQLAANDGAADDRFGVAVAISGKTAVVGASFHNTAYVFGKSTSGWAQSSELTAPDGATIGAFGQVVALANSTVVIGAPTFDSAIGAAYVFDAVVQSGEVEASDGAADDEFGHSVAVSGTTAIVGAPGHNSGTGAAYVEKSAGTSGWVQTAELTAAGGASFDNFGTSVAMTGSTAVVGAPGRSSSRGAVYVFTRVGTVWTQTAVLTASDGAPGDFFGTSVAIAGTYVIVGATGRNAVAGAAYIFKSTTLVWTQVGEITASDGAALDKFGASVAIAGTAAIVGAPNHDSTGAVYAFKKTTSGWAQAAELTGSDTASGDNFGVSVAMFRTTAIVGALGHNSNAGAAYVFTNGTSGWSEDAELEASDGVGDDFFGVSVAINNAVAMVGAHGRDSAVGAAFVFTNTAAGWALSAELNASDRASTDIFGSSVAVSGFNAVIGAPGRNSAAGAAYMFRL